MEQEQQDNSNVDNTDELQELRRKLAAYEENSEHVDLLKRIAFNRDNWEHVVDFVKNNGLTYFIALIAMTCFEILFQSRSFYCLMLLIICITTYLYPLLSKRERFSWEHKTEKSLKEAHVNTSSMKQSLQNTVTGYSRTDNEEVQNKATKSTDVTTTEETPQAVAQKGHASYNFIAAAVGGVDLVGLFLLPFLTIDLPMLGTRSVRLYDLLDTSNSIAGSVGIDTTSLTVILYILIICPIVYIVCALVPVIRAKRIGMLSALVSTGAVGYIVYQVISKLQEFLVNTPDIEGMDFDVTQFIGPGFWIVLFAPVIMLILSIVIVIRSTQTKG